MTIGQRISRRVKHMQKGKPFVGSLFANEGEPSSVNRVLSRMVRAGALERVARRVYMRPKLSELVGTPKPLGYSNSHRKVARRNYSDSRRRGG